MQLVLTTELLVEAYRRGLFPMAHSANSPYVHWICPEERGQLPIEEFHISKSLLKTLKKKPFTVKIDTDFAGVIKGCAKRREDRPETWINDQIMKAYTKLHERGIAHSVECWAGDELVGGLYGLKIGAAFFGESMFSTHRDASKVALVHLVARLWQGGFKILDTQFVNDHLKQFGVYEIPHAAYMKALAPILEQEADFHLSGKREEEILDAYLAFRRKHD